MASVTELIVRLKDEVSASAGRMSGALSSLSGTISSFIGVVGVGVAARALIDAVSESEDAIARLRASMVASNQESESYIQSLQNQAAAFQQLSVHSDEAIIHVQSLLVSFGAAPESIKNLTQTVLDFAAGMRIDLDTAVRVVAKAMGGNTSALSRYGIVIDDTLPKQERINKAIEELGSKFAGQAAAQMNTLGGSLKVFGNMLGELLEQVGKLAIRPGFTSWLKDASFLLGELNKALSPPSTPQELTAAIERLQGQLEHFRRFAPGDIAAIKRVQDEIERLSALREKLQAPLPTAPATRTDPVLIKQQEAIQKQIEAVRNQAEAVGKTGSALAALTLAQKINAIETRISAGEHEGLLRILQQEEKRLFGLKEAFDALSRGRKGVEAFESLFGIEIPAFKMEAASKLADQLVLAVQFLGSQGGTREQVATAFKNFIERAIALGVPDIAELLMEKFDTKTVLDILRELDEPTMAAVDATRQLGQQWGEMFRGQLASAVSALGDLGVALQTLEQRQQELVNITAQGLALMMDVSQPLEALNSVQSWLDAIPGVTRKAIIIDVLFSESPPRPFSEFVPMMERRLSDLSRVVSRHVPDIIFNTSSRASRSPSSTRATVEKMGDISIFMDNRGADRTGMKEGVRYLERTLRRLTGKEPGFRVRN